MANKKLFQSIVGKLLPRTDALNEEHAPAYRMSSEHALAQLAATGCLNGTFYATAETQLAHVLELTEQVAPEFIAQTALYARTQGYMKDLPALLTAVLSVRSPGLMAEVFDRVIDSPKMLRNFVQIMRSGAVGRKSLGSMPKRMIQQWLDQRSDVQLFIGSIGNDPSLADVIKMVHPRPTNPQRAAMLGYMIDREVDHDMLPALVREFEAYKTADDRASLDVPDVPFQMLTSLDLGPAQWKAIAARASWQTTRMNLNTFVRHGVFERDPAMVQTVADRLRDPKLIARARAYPYQLMIAYMAASKDLPNPIRNALQDALDTALANVPKIDGKVYVFPDVSGSMHSPVTGFRKGSTTAVRCVDVAGLIAAAVLRNNPNAEVIPFETDVVDPRRMDLNPRDSVMTNATKLASLPGGGTNCSAPLQWLNSRKATGDLLIYVSDYESWIDAPHFGRFGGSATQTMHQWNAFKQRSPLAKMICIDLQPHTTTQAKERDDVINVGGFSDRVFDLIATVGSGQTSAGHWVRQIQNQRL
ncbi:RNA-binding protein [Planctomycetales bacterium ZRK34]|nr:RNA-binding protein [Planctomycetales bacterium ZRK34]